jgi:hypothetical protein
MLGAHPHERLERGPVKGLARVRGHVAASHVDVSRLLFAGCDLKSLVGGSGRKGLGGMHKGRRGTKNGSAGTP